MPIIGPETDYAHHWSKNRLCPTIGEWSRITEIVSPYFRLDYIFRKPTPLASYLIIHNGHKGTLQLH
jgi:hypothetical protein